LLAFALAIQYEAAMHSSIRESIVSLATKFADDLLAIVWGGLAAELATNERSAPALTAARRPRARRSEGDLRAAADRILAALGKAPGGLRSEDLRSQVGMSRAAMGRPLKMLLASGRVRKTGEKRTTAYHAGGAPAKAAAEPKASASARPKAARPAKKAPKAKAKAPAAKKKAPPSPASAGAEGAAKTAG
jgi:hypothetical protein